MPALRFGLCLPNYGPATSPSAITEVAHAAEELGYQSLWATDHVLVPQQHGQAFGQVMEALVTLGYLAAITQHITLGTSVLVLPQRDPILVAKQVAAIDQLSSGRVILGIGVGWMAEEYRFLRSDFQRRGRMADEWIEVMRTLWSQERPAFSGRWINFDASVFEPKPVQPGGPPILVGGGSDAALRRAAVLGDGWHPVGIGIDALAQGSEKLNRWSGGRSLEISLRSHVRIGEEAEVYHSSTGGLRQSLSGLPETIVDLLHGYVEAGLNHLVCYFRHQTAGELLHQLQVFADEVIPAFR